MTIWKNLLNGTISFLNCIMIIGGLVGFIFLVLYISSIVSAKLLGGILLSMFLLALWVISVAVEWE